MIRLITKQEFPTERRDPLLDYQAYQVEAEDLTSRIPKAAKRLSDPDWIKGKDIATLLRLTRARAEYSLDLLSLSYSAGARIDELAGFLPNVLAYYEEYAMYSEAYNASPEGSRNPAPHLALADVDFHRASRLLCFAILLGWQELVPRVMDIVDYKNPVRDGMLERLAARFVERPSPPPSECVRHLPYYKTLRIFDAGPSERPGMMSEYLDDWYEASRREPYHGMHGAPRFQGYWSWESGAITAVLGIDDTMYREKPFYPREIVDFYQQRLAATDAQNRPQAKEIRAKAGDRCPIGGTWESVGIPAEREQYAQGTEMRQLGSPYGLTVWRYVKK
ncbi:DUF1911 domain-containing protein [Massilia agri]|uniref:DUF1911 domain-containing protein n=1 Tax=Massilia agri TaxID=1886785 RepID=A0ABT2APP9_9BURK|nr:DUF1911 domain-containing protein [Massilia agri]MCS0598111.1 DUF1911 domain-containing protein [Massilia agri]